MGAKSKKSTQNRPNKYIRDIASATRPLMYSNWKHSIHLLKGIMIFCVSLAILDVCGARLRYHFHLGSELKPLKIEILRAPYEYHGSVPVELQHCQAFDKGSESYVHNCTLAACEQNAFLLSEKRQEILHNVRSIHPIAEFLSRLFDHTRGMNQQEKIQNLFSSKSCERIISSSDKTNFYIDSLAVILACITLLFMWISIRSFFN